MMKLLVVIATCLSFSTVFAAEPARPANETPLPKEPAGYRWERFTEVQSAFLCPDGWYTFHKAGTNSHTYVISKESVATNGLFETGLTLQAVKGLLTKKGVSPSGFAVQMAQGLLEKHENTTLSTQDISSGPFKAFFLRYRNAPATVKPIVVHKVFIANNKKDTLFIVTFEAPEKQWDEAWRLGEPMVKKFLIDDEY